MEDLLPTIRGIIVSAWRFRWVAMLCAWLVSLVGYVVIASIPDSYEAQAVVFVDLSSVEDAALVLPTIAHALGASEAQGEDPVHTAAAAEAVLGRALGVREDG